MLIKMHFLLLLSTFYLFLGSTFSQPECPVRGPRDCTKFLKYRSFDGTCNNLKDVELGKTGQCAIRLLQPDYGPDTTGDSSIRMAKSGKELPNERLISNAYLRDRNESDSQFTLLSMIYGQFLTEQSSHLSEPRRNPNDLQFGAQQWPCCEMCKPNLKWCTPIYIDPNDEFYSQFNLTCFNTLRSLECEQCEGTANNPKIRKQNNDQTNYLDNSNLYTTASGDNTYLRENVGGRMVTSKSPIGRTLLPQRYDGPGRTFTSDSCIAKHDSVCFRAGGGPINQNPGLTSLTTLMHFQHNKIADKLASLYPKWTDGTLFQEARRILTAQTQHINYNEYLPIVVGPKYMRRFHLWPIGSDGFVQMDSTRQIDSNFTLYNSKMTPMITVEFATAAFRFGHSAIQDSFFKIYPNGKEIRTELKDQYFHPTEIFKSGIGPFLIGLLVKPQAGVDPFFADGVRNHLYQPFGKPFGLDLASINVRRGREHGIQSYINYIKFCDNVIIRSFDDLARKKYIASDRVKSLKQIYKSLEDIDLYVGGLSEIHVEGGQVGPTFACILSQQFERYKFADRYFYEHGGLPNSFTSQQLALIKKTTLAGIICFAAEDTSEYLIQPKTLILPDNRNNIAVRCSEHFDLVGKLGSVNWE